MNERKFRLLIGFFFSVGIGIGYFLSRIPDLQTYKLLNVAGLLYTFLGVLVLSEHFATDKWKDFCVNKLAPSVLWVHTIVPFGAFLAGFTAHVVRKPSGGVVCSFSLAFWAYCMAVLLAFEQLVVSPKFPFIKRDIHSRWRWLGLFLVLGGVLSQLTAGVMDLLQ